MRAIVGLVSILVVMAIVAVLMKQNLSATRNAGSPGPAAVDGVKVPQIDTSKNVRDQSQQIQNQVRDELNQALQQGDQRLKDADK